MQRVNHNVGLLKLFTVLDLLHKRMPDSHERIQLCTTSRIKTKKLVNKKNTYMLLDSNPHILSAKITRLSTRLSRNCD